MAILDSGNRTEFSTGAVRDMQEGRGRCDLLPLDVIADKWLFQNIETLKRISEFKETHDENNLYLALISFCNERNWCIPTMLLEVSKHFEEGAEKYGEYNWQKGIPVKCYINSAIRHYLKWLRGDDDEPHDRAFCWNILCCIWTVKHIKEA